MKTEPVVSLCAYPARTSTDYTCPMTTGGWYWYKVSAPSGETEYRVWDKALAAFIAALKEIPE